jgi:glycosyltransferase involved in cell wall biosynthesis
MREQRRVAVFLPALYGGGAERTMLNLAGGIACRGYSVDLVLAQAEGPYLNDVPSKVRLVDLGRGRIVERNRTLRRLPSLVRYLRHEQPDAMLSALSRANFAALFARRAAGLPKRVVVNEQAHVSTDAANQPSRFVRMWPHFAKYVYRWADSVVGVSQGVVDDLVQVVGIPAHLARVICNPVITSDLDAKANASLDHPWFQPGEPPVVLAVGRLTKQKDFPTLMRAFARVRQSRRVRLLILGEGSERQSLEALSRELGVGEDVGLPGFADNPYPYMTRASVYAMSSRWEGLPTVLIEALRCGARVVSTDCPSGPREILRNGEIGRLVPMSNPQALAEAIVAALDGDVPRPSPESWRPYALETIVDQYVELLLGANGSSS